mgnify:CR=1 FL=1
MKRNFSTIPFQIRVEKPWGWELILPPFSSPVTGKILHLNSGHRFSLQYHDKKEETLTLVSGQAQLILENETGQFTTIEMESQKGYLIKPLQKHRAKGITDCDILEVSTPEVGNTYRLEDDYNRSIETEEARAKLRE